MSTSSPKTPAQPQEQTPYRKTRMKAAVAMGIFGFLTLSTLLILMPEDVFTLSNILKGLAIGLIYGLAQGYIGWYVFKKPD